jgi:hypothetical protein
VPATRYVAENVIGLPRRSVGGLRFVAAVAVVVPSLTVI